MSFIVHGLQKENYHISHLTELSHFKHPLWVGKPGGMCEQEVQKKPKKTLDIIEFFFFLQVSKYSTFPLPLNNVS